MHGNCQAWDRHAKRPFFAVLAPAPEACYPVRAVRLWRQHRRQAEKYAGAHLTQHKRPLLKVMYCPLVNNEKLRNNHVVRPNSVSLSSCVACMSCCCRTKFNRANVVNILYMCHYKLSCCWLKRRMTVAVQHPHGPEKTFAPRHPHCCASFGDACRTAVSIHNLAYTLFCMSKAVYFHGKNKCLRIKLSNKFLV